MMRATFLALAVLLAVLLAPSSATAQSLQAKGGALDFPAATENPAITTAVFGYYKAVTIQVTATAGAHDVTVETRICQLSEACSWVAQAAAAGSFVGGATVHEFTLAGVGQYVMVRVTVTNAGLNTVSGWHRLGPGL